MEVKIAPSLLSCDFSKLDEEIKAIEKAGADLIHVDVMDGHFVDNLTLGPPIISAIRKCTKLPFDVHLMIDNAEEYLGAFVKAGANILTLHIEALRDPKSALQKIRTLGAKPGLTLRPSTPLTAIEPYLSLVDLVLVMTVEPGWGGQAFMTEQTQKISTLRKWASKNNPDLWIEVDGGITDNTAALAVSAGANVLVAGSFIFRAPQKNYSAAIGALRAHS